MRGEDEKTNAEAVESAGNTSTCVEKTILGHVCHVMGSRNTSTCVEKTAAGGLETGVNRNTSTCVEKTATSCGEIGWHHQDAVEFDFLGGIRTI